MITASERHAPLHWLAALEDDASAFPRLVHDCGGLALAAWRVASARRRARLGQEQGTPSTRELESAALELAERVGWNDPAPSPDALRLICELSGLVVRH